MASAVGATLTATPRARHRRVGEMFRGEFLRVLGDLADGLGFRALDGYLDDLRRGRGR